jgi:hypothetical protein
MTDNVILVGACSACRKGHRVAGVPHMVEVVTEGRFLAAGKVFRRMELQVGGVPLYAKRIRKAGVDTVRYSSSVYCDCRRGRATLKAVVGKVNQTPCDARCTEAKGHNCECACGGQNHGNAHAA